MPEYCASRLRHFVAPPPPSLAYQIATHRVDEHHALRFIRVEKYSLRILSAEREPSVDALPLYNALLYFTVKCHYRVCRVPATRTYWKCQSHNIFCYEKNHRGKKATLFSLFLSLSLSPCRSRKKVTSCYYANSLQHILFYIRLNVFFHVKLFLTSRLSRYS